MCRPTACLPYTIYHVECFHIRPPYECRPCSRGHLQNARTLLWAHVVMACMVMACIVMSICKMLAHHFARISIQAYLIARAMAWGDIRSHGLYRYGLYSHGLYSLGLNSYGLVMSYIVMACIVMACSYGHLQNARMQFRAHIHTSLPGCTCHGMGRHP